MENQRYLKQVVLVTGGATGIGAVACEKFALEGAKVAINHAPSDRDRAACQELVERISRQGGVAKGYECDISDREKVFEMVTTIKADFGIVDALVCNAFTAVFKGAFDITQEDVRRIIDVNLAGTFWCVQACLPGMIEKQLGSVLFVSSNSVVNGGGASVIYPASKCAMEGLMNGLIYEFPKSGVRFNTLRPGPTNTQIQSSRHTEEQWAEYQDRQPTGRVSEPKEVANAILFMSDSKNVGTINGATLFVDGARTYHMKAYDYNKR